jgi:hypothetical protein
VNVLAAISAPPVAFEALLGGKKDDLVAFLAKGQLVPSLALATATMMAHLVDVARITLYPLGLAMRENVGSAQAVQSARYDDGSCPPVHLALPGPD